MGSGNFASNKSTQAITGINVTPLVDITLVLLVIFMVTAKLVVSRALPMDLPKAASGGEVEQTFSVSLREDGRSLVNGAPSTSDRALFDAAKSTLSRHPNLRVVLQADGTVPHHRVMHALDVLRQAGLTRIAFGVQAGPPVTTEAAP